MQLNPGQHTHQDQNTRHNRRPKLDPQEPLRVVRLRRRTHRRQCHGHNDVPTCAVILIHTLRILHTAIHLRREILSEPDYSLQEQEHVSYDAENRVHGFEMRAWMSLLVELDDDEAGCQSRGSETVEAEVVDCAGALLFSGMGGLEDESALSEKEEASLVKT